jgi:tetratricopeptide (TPR) repeat protein
MELAAGDYLRVGIEIESPQHYAAKIYEHDKYYGSLAWSTIFLSTGDHEKGEKVLKELLDLCPKKPEAYLKLWNFYYSTQSFQSSLEIAERAFLNISRKGDYAVVTCLNYARSLFKVGKVRNCLELLQIEYTKHSLFTVILYHYGRFCIKSKDLNFLGSAIGALEECLNTSSEARHGQIFYWLSKAYLLAEEKIEAFACAKKAIPLLSSFLEKLETSDKNYENNLNRKLNELKDIMKELHIHLISIDLLERLLEEPPLKIEECKIYCDALKGFDMLEGSLYEAKMWWKGENIRKAKEILYSRLNFTRVKMKGYFLLMDILEHEMNYDEMLGVSKEMVRKCRSPMIPVQIWIQANMIYADCLIKQKRYNESLFVYKTLAQVQPIPYIPDLRYTRELQRASNKEELDSVITKINNGPSRNSYLISSQNDFEMQRAKPVSSKNIFATIFMNFDEDCESLSELTLISTDKSESEVIGNRAPEPLAKVRLSSIPCGDSANIGFSVTTSYIFLYKIGKTCAKFKICTEEGLLALHDFLNTHHYWTREGIEVHEELKVKAKYWLGMLYYQSGQIALGEEVFRDILSMLFQLGRNKMSDEVLKILNSR